jgi:hypothetical protein
MLAVHDGFDALLLGCFFFGLIFALASLLGGIGGAGHLHLPVHTGQVHLPGHVGHIHLPGHVGHLHAPQPGHASAADGSHGQRETVGPLNLSSLLVFISWFGGWAYLARNGLHWVLAVSLLVGFVAGLIGAALVFLWFAKVLVRMETALDPADFRLPGTLARITSSIRAGGVGEIIYEKGGVWQVSAARSCDGKAIARGTEVVIRACERGIAAVEPWEDFLGERHRDLAPKATASVEQISEIGSERYPRSPDQPHDPGDAWANRQPVILAPPAA